MKRYKLKLPDWTKTLADNAMLNSGEVAKFFGFTQAKSVCNLSVKGMFPKPVVKSRKNTLGGRAQPFNQWSMKALREFELNQDKED